MKSVNEDVLKDILSSMFYLLQIYGKLLYFFILQRQRWIVICIWSFLIAHCILKLPLKNNKKWMKQHAGVVLFT